MNRESEQILNELLVLRAQNGDATAIQLLVRRWNSKFIRHACRLTKHRESAADVTQEGWIAIFRGLHRLRDPAHFRSWAYRIIQNKSVDWIRSQSRARQTNREVAAQCPETDEPESSSGAHQVDQLRSAIERLPEDKQVLLRMFYEDQMSIKEIAVVLSLPEGTVKYQLHDVRKSLRTIIERDSS